MFQKRFDRVRCRNREFDSKESVNRKCLESKKWTLSLIFKKWSRNRKSRIMEATASSSRGLALIKDLYEQNTYFAIP